MGLIYNGIKNRSNFIFAIYFVIITKTKAFMQQNKDYTYFFHLTSPFSNFHPAKFEYKGITFISNEQFMMYSKAKTFNDEDSSEKILELNQDSLAQKFLHGELSRVDIVKDKLLSDQWNKLMMKVKKLGRGVQNYNEEIWKKRREKIVLFGARLKFTQNYDLKDILIATGYSKMVESSQYDKIWGSGLSEYDCKKIPEEKWPGLNLLGKVLDTLKTEFKNELTHNTSNITHYQPIEVANFYHLGKQIPEDGVYIGRFNHTFQLSDSKFANPFPMKSSSEEERNRVVNEYEIWLWKEIANEHITKEDLLSLNGKKLICYCSPKKCHGHVLKEVVELLFNNEKEFDHQVKNYRENKKLKF